MDKKKTEHFRLKLFLQIDGIVLIPIFNFLLKEKIIDFIIDKNRSLNDIVKEFKINKGYINVCLRALCSSGFLKNEKNIYIANKKNIEILSKFSFEIQDFVKLLNYYKKFSTLIKKSDSDNSKYIKLIKLCHNHLILIKTKLDIENDKEHFFIYNYIEGIFLGPIISYLGFTEIIINKSECLNEKMGDLSNIFIDIFIKEGYLHTNQKQLTHKGNFFFKRSFSYGVTVSYLETFIRLDELLYKKNYFMWKRDKNGYELHINRPMNVWGSGGAHKFYFKKIDEIIINIFNKKIEHQPKGIIDIGCGDGTFLEHVYDLAINHSIRKNHIKEYPLKLIGVDINKAARDASRERLEKRNIDHLIIKGNISDPDSINRKLMKKFKLNLKDLLNSRTFLDHNRIYSYPKTENKLLKQSTGGFCFKGNYISSDQLGNNLIEHLSLWKPYINKHGIIILELHTIHPDDSNKYRGENLSCAYDTTHGFSDQYLVEYDFYIYCCKNAGLKLKDNFLFPNEKIPTVSVGYFK